MALGVNVAIGSDHASSGIVDMSQEMRLACCCYKEMRLNPRVMPPETGLEMATVNGAKAALMADRIGSIEVGKEADVVLFDTRRPEWQPLINPVANLVYSATGDSVRDVFVAGEQVVAGGTLTKIDESKLYDEIPVAVARFGKQPQDRPDGAIALAGVLTMDARTHAEVAGARASSTGWNFRSRIIRRRAPRPKWPTASSGFRPGAVRRTEAGQSSGSLRDGDGWTMIDCGYGAAGRARADRRRSGPSVLRRPADHAADRDALSSRPRRQLALDQRALGAARCR